MPSRFYYAPVQGGSLLSGAARGIEAGVDNLDTGLRRKRAAALEAEETGRRRTREDVDLDIALMDRRGGRGEIPDVDVPLVDYGRTPTTEAPEFFQRDDEPLGGAAAQALMPGPEFTPKQYSVPRADPRYRSIGPDGFGYVMTPDALEDEERARGAARAVQDRADIMGRQGDFISGVASGDIGRTDPDFGRGALSAALEDTPIDAFDFLPDRFDSETDPTLGRERVRRGLGQDPQTGRTPEEAAALRTPRAPGVDRTTPTYTGAMELLQNQYAIVDAATGAVTGYSISPERMDAMARRISQGPGAFDDFPPIVPSPGDDVLPPPTADDISDMRSRLSGYPKSDWAEILRNAGVPEEHIGAIVG